MSEASTVNTVHNSCPILQNDTSIISLLPRRLSSVIGASVQKTNNRKRLPWPILIGLEIKIKLKSCGSEEE